jgi:acetylornithine deacetylase
MNPIDVPQESWVVQSVARNHEQVTGHPPATIGAILPMSYSAGDACWLWGAGIPCVYYGPGGGFLEQGPEGSYMLISEMVACARVLALTALEACG